MTPLLSILTPAVPSRMAQLAKLCDELAKQIGGLAVEHLTLLDNKRRSVGLKRQALLDIARGDYVDLSGDAEDGAPHLLSLDRPQVLQFVRCRDRVRHQRRDRR